MGSCPGFLVSAHLLVQIILGSAYSGSVRTTMITSASLRDLKKKKKDKSTFGQFSGST